MQSKAACRAALAPHIYIYIPWYIVSFATAVSEAFASDFVLNLGWDPRRLRFPRFVLAFSTAFPEGRARRAPTGVLPCALLGVSRYRRARRPRTRRIFVGARRHGGSIIFCPEDLFRGCCKRSKGGKHGQQACTQDLND